MPQQHVTHIRTIKRIYGNAYVRLNGKRPVIFGDREDVEVLNATGIDHPMELEERVLSAIELLPGHSQEPMLLSMSGAQGVEITRHHGVNYYRIEICVKGRWRRLHGTKAQRAIEHDLALAKKARVDLASDATAPSV
ncbi:MAG: hypothetical protein U0526_01065 [Candidatus Saccharibacteria bacterium]|jgi:hypothetical protein